MWSIVTDRVAWSVSRSVTLVSPAKTAGPIEMPFGLRTWVGPRNHVLDWGPDPPCKGAILRGKGSLIVKCRDSLRSSVQKQLNRSRGSLGCGLGWESCVTLGGPDPPWEGTILGERGAHTQVYGHSLFTCEKTAEPIPVPFGSWTRMGRRKHKFNRMQ